MKYSYLKLLGKTPELNIQKPFEQDILEQTQQIEQIRFALKKLYFQKRTILIDTLIEIMNQNGKQTDQILNLKLPQNIQKHREQYFTIKEKLIKFTQRKNKNHDLSISQEEPFNKLKQRILNKHKLKRKYIQEMKHQNLIEDSLKVQKQIILDIYKQKLKQFYKLDDHMQQQQKNKKSYLKKSNTIQRGNSIGNSKSLRFLQKQSYFQSASGKKIQSNSAKNIKQKGIDTNKESIVVQNLKNPNSAKFMKINDSNLEMDDSMDGKNPQSVGNLINDFIENDKQFSLKGQTHKLNASFQQSGYRNYLNEQKKQLQEQKKRMMKLTQQANRAISNQEFTDSEEQTKSVKNQFSSQKKRNQQSKNDLNLDDDGKFQEINQIKCLFGEVIDLFILSEVIKFQIQNRTFQIISKLFSNVSTNFNQKIQLQEAISSTTFGLAVKTLLTEDFEYRSEVDTVVNKIFRGKNVLQYQEFSQQFKSVLNKKQFQMLDSIDNKNEVDRTILKTKRLFLTWISISYFEKRIKQIIRKNQLIATTIMKQCAQDYDSQDFDSSLLGDFFSEGNSSNIQKTKTIIYFKHILGQQLKRSHFIQWCSSNTQNMFSKRYQRKGAKNNQQFQK